jgi:hypothetical protein
MKSSYEKKDMKIKRMWPIIKMDNNRLFRSDIEPRNEHGFITLNPSVMYDNYAKDFHRLKNSQYTSSDPRLISPSYGGQVLKLDNPPVETDIHLDQLATDESLNNYGQGYSTYSDINAGNITYYIDKSIRDPFYSPNFTTPAYVYGKLYIDPMGAFKPRYERVPVKCNNPLDTKKNIYDGELSWIQDSGEHRQDLMSHQMSKQNQQKWSSTVNLKM